MELGNNRWDTLLKMQVTAKKTTKNRLKNNKFYLDKASNINLQWTLSKTMHPSRLEFFSIVRDARGNANHMLDATY